jgi:hypothetical protein
LKQFLRKTTSAQEGKMPKLTILNHWQGEVDITINDDDPVTISAGEKLVRTMDGPVRLGAAASGAAGGWIRPGAVADGLVQDRVLVLEVPDPNAAALAFRVA